MQGIIEHSIIFDDKIDNETVSDLINEMTNYSFVNLYFSTNGGELYAMEVLVDYLNRRCQDETVRVYIGPILISAGTFLMTDYIGPLFLTRSFQHILFHLPDMPAYSRRKEEKEYGRRVNVLLDSDNEDYLKSLSALGLSKSQIKKIADGEDVKFYRDDLDKLSYAFFTEEETVVQKNLYKFEPKKQSHAKA